MKTVIIDNYDSFTYNLAHLLKQLGTKVDVLRNDQFDPDGLEVYDKILLSPGPGIPCEAGLMPEVIRTYAGRKPILGICRGMQILNAACGGELLQDLSLREEPSLNHMQRSRLRSDICHTVLFKKDSMLYEIFGDHTAVNSFHHQAVNFPGKGVSVTARSQDGAIEAIELDSHPFALGVQWHPECMYRTSGEMRDLFHEFVSHSLINR